MRRPCQAASVSEKKRRDCVELESMTAEVWYDGTWDDWLWRDPNQRCSPFIDSSSWMDGTTGDDLRHGQTRVGDNGFRSLTPPVVIHGSMVGNGPKLFSRWTKSWLGGRPACWTPAKAKLKNCLMSGAGDGRRDRMSLRQQLMRREPRSTSHREMPCSRRFLELVRSKG